MIARRSFWPGAAGALVSGALFMLSRDMGPFGGLVLIAPIPLLLYALSGERAWPVFAWSCVADALGHASLVAAYLTVFPPVVLGLWIATQSLLYAGIVLATRWIARNDPPWAALLAYPLLIAGSEFLFDLVSPHGSFGALGYALTGILPLLQLASLGGVAALSFAAAFVPMALALLIRMPARRRQVALLAGIPSALALLWGEVRLNEAYDGRERVALAAIDAVQDDDLPSSEPALRNAAAYAAIAERLGADDRPDVVVFPEKALIQKPGWANVGAPLQAAADRSGIPILAGWAVTDADGGRDNRAVLYRPDGPPRIYRKRHLIPGLEADFTPGRDSLVEGDLGIAICKDMDFAPTIRDYGRRGVRLMLVPAWDFRSDAALHARMALVRGVENGFAVARAAADGYLTISDAFGREIAARATEADRPVTLVAEVGLRTGRTLYNRVGDLAGWLAVGFASLLIARRLLRSFGSVPSRCRDLSDTAPPVT